MTYSMCSSCVMDTSDSGIAFDDEGVCSHCRAEAARKQLASTGDASLQDAVLRIKADGKNKPYDCVIGLSGGVDSSYVALMAHDHGLRPMCVHFDNGWNREIAVDNIQRIVQSLHFDLNTYVIDWPEFRDLQRAFLKAGVIDLEMLSDHAIFASMYRLCRESGIRHILSGTNFATESGLPRAWIWPKMDWRNIKAIHRAFGEIPLRTFPHMPTWRYLAMRYLHIGATWHEPLNYIRYVKSEAIERLKRQVGWREYGGKHHESRITRFYQNYILPQKFGVDKRKSHLSALIRGGEISRQQALIELEQPLYDTDELRRDREFVLKKLGFTDQEFSQIMSSAPVPHESFATDQTLIVPLIRIVKGIRTRLQSSKAQVSGAPSPNIEQRAIQSKRS